MEVPLLNELTSYHCKLLIVRMLVVAESKQVVVFPSMIKMWSDGCDIIDHNFQMYGVSSSVAPSSEQDVLSLPLKLLFKILQKRRHCKILLSCILYFCMVCISCCFSLVYCLLWRWHFLNCLSGFNYYILKSSMSQREGAKGCLFVQVITSAGCWELFSLLSESSLQWEHYDNFSATL